MKMTTTINKTELFHKKTISPGVGYFVPIDGAICKFKVLKDDYGIITELDNHKTREITIGEADCLVDHILEACLCTTKEDEVCQITLNISSKEEHKPLEKENKSRAKYLEDIEELKSPVVEEAIGREDLTLLKTLEESQGLNNKSSEEIIETVNEPDDIEEKESCNAPEDRINTSIVTIQLLSFTRQPEIWEMSVTEKWRRATHHKEQGVELFSKGDYRWAFRRFSTAMKYLISVEQDIPPERLEDEIDVKGLKLACYLNLAACHLKKPNYESAAKVCSKALELDAYNAKALYRRGSALIQMQDYDNAKKDLDSAAELEPKNAAIAKQQQLLKARVQKLNKYYAKAMKKMFA